MRAKASNLGAMTSFLANFDGPPLTLKQRQRLAQSDLPIIVESGAGWQGDQLEMTSHAVKVQAADPKSAEGLVRKALPEYPFEAFEIQPYPLGIAV